MRGSNKDAPRKRVRKTTRTGRRDMAVKLPEITGGFVEFACLIRAITGEVARVTAANRAGVSHDTIARMWRGEKVGENMILRFAFGYRTDPNPLLTAAGYKPIPHFNPEEIGAGYTANQEIRIHGGETIIVSWLDEQDVVVEVTPEVKSLLGNVGTIQQSGRD